MRLTRIAAPLLAATLAACAGNAGPAASASPEAAAAQGQSGVTLLNRRAALTAMQNNYPALLRDALVTGSVEVTVTLGGEGRVTEVGLRNSTDYQFEPAARRVAENLLFSPPAAAGQRVIVRMEFIPAAMQGRRASIEIVD